jgi:enamine deaminase RidA (YjgF/YER057c/UK114 family)
LAIHFGGQHFGSRWPVGEIGMEIEKKLEAMGLVLPPEAPLPPGSSPPHYIRVRKGIVYLSGQGARKSDGTIAGPFGKVPSEVSIEETRESAKGCALALLSTLKREIGDLDRISAWLSVTAMVNADPGFDRTSAVTNGFSEFILELFGEAIGHHARVSPGMAALPGNACVVIGATVEIDG